MNDCGLSRADRRINPAFARWYLRTPGRLFPVILALLFAALATAAGAEANAATVQNVADTLNAAQGYGEMNRTLSVGLVIGISAIIPLGLWLWLHNSLVSKEERVFESWAQTESNLQRRADLIPALVGTVSRYLRHEGDTLTAVTEKRTAAATQVSKAIEALMSSQKETSDMMRDAGRKLVEDDAAFADFARAQSAVEHNITTLLAVAEDYPELRSSDQFLELQAQLEGTENRINVARMRFNDSVRQYNAAIRKIPGNLIASLGGFARKAYFETEDEAQHAPALQFD